MLVVFYKYQYLFLLILVILFTSCTKTESNPIKYVSVRGCDMSLIGDIRHVGVKVYDSQRNEGDMIDIIKKSGCNLVRLRVWHNDADNLFEVENLKSICDELRSKGLSIMLSIHYSDTWADPSHQTKPNLWNTQNINVLSDSVYNYTAKTIQLLKPDYVQIGNEINNGFLWPQGHFSNLDGMKMLIKRAVSAVRENSSKTKVILHYAGYEGAEIFYEKLTDIDYDIIGISYYPMWHGKDLDRLKNILTDLNKNFNKSTIIAETSYPFTLSWNDMTNNIIGSNSQILMQFAASPEGQRGYLNFIKSITSDSPGCLGFCYWGGEWISYQGGSKYAGSPYENQSLWDFDNVLLPAASVLSAQL